MCPPTLLKLEIISRSLLVEFFGSLMYRIMPSTNRDSWTYSFSVCTPLIFFSCLLHQCFKHNAETEWESGQRCHAHDLSGIASGSSPFRMMLAVNSS